MTSNLILQILAGIGLIAIVAMVGVLIWIGLQLVTGRSNE